MSYIMRKMLGGYMEQAGKEGSTGEGDAAAKAAAEAAAKAAADAAAKKAADEAAAAAAKGKKFTDDEAAELLKENMAKKAALKEANARLAELEGKIKDFDGIDATAIKKLLAEKQAAEEEAAVRKGEWEKVKKQIVDQHDVAIKAKDTELATTKQTVVTLEDTIADLTVGNAFGNSQYVKDDLALTANKARKLYGAHFEFDKTTRQVIGYDKPAGSKDRAPLVDGKGEPLDFEAAFKKIIDADPEKDSLLKSKIAAGAGSTSSHKGKPAAAAAAGEGEGDGQPKGIARIKVGLDEREKATKK